MIQPVRRCTGSPIRSCAKDCRSRGRGMRWSLLNTPRDQSQVFNKNTSTEFYLLTPVWSRDWERSLIRLVCVLSVLRRREKRCVVINIVFTLCLPSSIFLLEAINQVYRDLAENAYTSSILPTNKPLTWSVLRIFPNRRKCNANRRLGVGLGIIYTPCNKIHSPHSTKCCHRRFVVLRTSV